ETLLKFAITNYYVEQYTSGAGSATFVSFRGKIEVAYQAVEAKSGVALDSENLNTMEGYDPGKACKVMVLCKPSSGSNSANVTRDALVNGIVDAMGKRVAPTEEPFVAPLPVKKLEPLSSRLAMNRRW